MKLNVLMKISGIATVLSIATIVLHNRNTVRVRYNASAYGAGYTFGLKQGEQNAEKCFREMRKNKNMYSAFYSRYENGGKTEISDGYEDGYKIRFMERLSELVAEAVPDRFCTDEFYEEDYK